MKFTPAYLRKHKEYERTNEKPLTKSHAMDNSKGASSTYYGSRGKRQEKQKPDISNQYHGFITQRYGKLITSGLLLAGENGRNN